jgi:hypothetical protein
MSARRADYGDLPREVQIGILQYELDIAAQGTEPFIFPVTGRACPDTTCALCVEHRTRAARAALERMRVVIAERAPRAAPPGGLQSNPTHDEYNRG